ncbi:hypothetical protein GEV33_004680 [Tenebrio molitor]|uniref:Helicase C-terminal domain-containing protein n=1 Tax=Tenebrio molitor TaxID=7067 RepID=A0A8J6LD78_TENMO|nr:hypothetical protein GEV33_004680 [Tenebrio molitor]
MMQSGLSRELFESWCTDAKNGVIIAGYCVEGTLAKTILSEPEEITTMVGQKLPLKMSVDYISFSAHTDYQQTSEFIRILKPPHVVLVHGEQNEMSRLKAALQREYEDDPNTTMYLHNPRNTHCVELYFRGEKTAKVMGSLAVDKPKPGNTLSGVLVKRNFNYHLLAANDLPKYTDMSMSQIMQRQSIHYSGNTGVLRHLITQVAGLLEPVEGDKKTRAFNAIDITIDSKIVTLEWVANPVNDMYADAIVAAILQADLLDAPIKNLSTSVKVDRMHFKECLIEMLQDMFGEDSVPKMFKGEKLYVTVNDKKADIDLSNLEVTCPEDETFKQIVETAVSKLYQFTKDERGILVATDVAARGLDIPKIKHVLHYQTPRTSESYLHRSGRTARATQLGITVLLIDPSEIQSYVRMCKTLNKSQDLPMFPVQEDCLKSVKHIVNLGRQLDKLELDMRKENSEEGWLRKAAKEMDIIVDDLYPL